MPQAVPGRTPTDDRPPLGWIVAALLVAVAAVVTVVVWSNLARSAAVTGPLAVPSVDAPGAAGTSCTTLMAALPAELGGLHRRPLLDPSPGLAAWSDPALVLRCGIDTPAELTCSAALQEVNQVAWLRLADASATTYIVADRAVRIAVTLPPGSGMGPVLQLSDIVAAALPQRDICRSGMVLPPDNR